MSVSFNEYNDGLITATIVSPTGASYEVDPYAPLDAKISARSRGGPKCYNITLSSGKRQTTMAGLSLGEATEFLHEIKTRLNSKFWSQ
jgi:hypothetical protein